MSDGNLELVRPTRLEPSSGVRAPRPRDEIPRPSFIALDTGTEQLPLEGGAQPEMGVVDVLLDEHGIGLGGGEQGAECGALRVFSTAAEQGSGALGQGAIHGDAPFSTT